MWEGLTSLLLAYVGGSYAVVISSCERAGLTPLLLVDLAWSYMHLLLVKWECAMPLPLVYVGGLAISLGGRAYIITIGSRGRGLFFWLHAIVHLCY